MVDYVYGEYWYGNKISEYGIEHGYVDYATFAKAFNSVLANEIMEATNGVIGYWEQESGYCFEDSQGNQYSQEERDEKVEELEEKLKELDEQLYELEDDDELYEEIEQQRDEIQEDIDALEDYKYDDVYQWYIISSNGAEICERANEIVYYNDELDMYLWGVTHLGTSWNYVLTDIKCNYDPEKGKENQYVYNQR